MRKFTEEEIRKISEIAEESIQIGDLISFGGIYKRAKKVMKEELIPLFFPSPPFPTEDVESEIVKKMKKIKEMINELKLGEIL
ncbi:MAG: hypothetical protein QW734_08935 [Candidatus Bathyarchaeia archaeon]